MLSAGCDPNGIRTLAYSVGGVEGGSVEPRPVPRMFAGVLAMRVHEDVHVGEGQGRFSVKSQMAAESSRSTPGRTPSPLNVTMRKGSTPFRRAEFPRNWRTESSSTDVNVRPC